MNATTLMSKGRNTTIEILRIFFMFCIVMSHGIGHGSGLDYELIYSFGTDISTFFHLSMFSLGKIGVTGFMFISGYYGIKLNVKSLLTLIAICVFYSVFLYGGGKSLLFSYSNWWFIESYVIVCILAPFIEIGLKSIDRKTLIIALCGIFYYSYVGRFLKVENSHDAPMLLSIYILARAMATREEFKQIVLILKRTRTFITLLLVVMFVPVVLSATGVSFGAFLHWFQNNNTLYFLLSASFVLILADKYCSFTIVNKLSKGVLAIYLITDCDRFRLPLDTWLYDEIMQYRGYIYALLICFGCLFIDIVRQCMFEYALKLFRVVKNKESLL